MKIFGITCTVGRKMIRPPSTASLFFLSFLLYGMQRSERHLVARYAIVYMLLVSALYFFQCLFS